MKQQPKEHGTRQSPREKFMLIVEDDLVNAEVLELAITSETGYQVHLVSTAEADLHCIRERKPDLMLLDNWLPGMKGLEFYDYLHAIPAFSTVPALLMSASTPSQEGLHRPHLTFLGKPYELETLLETIRALLETVSVS